MSLLRNIASGVRSLFRKERVEEDLDEALRGFLEIAAGKKMKEGMSRKDALRAVRLERGSLEVTKEEFRQFEFDSLEVRTIHLLRNAASSTANCFPALFCALLLERREC